MKWLSNIDLFGIPFTFTAFKKRLFTTSVGGIISIACFIIGLVFTFLFGSNFFFRKNPIALSQTVIPSSYLNPIALNSTDFPIAWRIEDRANNLVNFTGVLYPVITYFYYDANSHGDLTLTKKIDMSITKSSVLNANSTAFNESVNPDQWNCFNWPEYNHTFGGYWDGSYAYYFNIILYYCPDGNNYKEGIGCTTLDDFIAKTATSNNWYFAVMYPEAIFDPNSVNPLKIGYKNYYYGFDPSLRKTDRIFFNVMDVEDDQGWILTEKHKSSVLSFNQIQSDFNYFGSDHYETVNINTGFYTCYFYMLKSYQLHTRSYMKFQDLCAIVGGFLKLILMLGELISFLANTHYMNEFLMSEIFKFDKEESSNVCNK